MVTTAMSVRERLVVFVEVAFAIVGVAAVVLLVRHVGARALLELLRQALPWMPLLIGLEALRIVAEAVGTRAVARLVMPERLTGWAWLRMHLVANATLVVLPAGRAVCESVKFVSLSASTGPGRAAAIVVVQQAMTLLAMGAISIPCALAAYGLQARLLALAIGIHGLSAVGAAFLLVLSARHAKLPRFASAWLMPSTLGTFRETMLALPWISPVGLLGKLLNRVLQAAQYAVCMVAVAGDTTAARALLADGASLVGSALGELIPAQVGAVDGALAYAAPQLGLTVAMAIAVATLARLSNLFWSAVGALTPMLRAPRRSRPRPSSNPTGP